MIALHEAIEVAVQEKDRDHAPPEESMPKWQKQLDAATSEGEVLAVVREYMATLSAGDIERLPDACKPREFDKVKEVKAYALALARHDCLGDGAQARLIGKMFDVFSNAEIRLFQLATR